MSKWRKRPVVIEAFLWTGGPDQEEDPSWIIEALGKDMGPGAVRILNPGGPDVHMNIWTLEGIMGAQPGDWIIRGVKGELYPCKADIFEATYEPA